MVGEKILAEAPLADELDQQHEPTIAIRLLIPDFRMGNLIGRSGSIIKSIQEDTGARMSASEEPLPMSTERTMTIHGTPKSIHLAVARVAGILAEHPERNNPNHMPYVPHTMNPSLGGMNRSGYSGGRGGRNGSSVTGGMSDGAYGMSVPGGMPFFYQGVRPSDYGNMPSNSNQSQQIYIPNDMVGIQWQGEESFLNNLYFLVFNRWVASSERAGAKSTKSGSSAEVKSRLWTLMATRMNG